MHKYPKTTIIAEIGVNHNGRMDLALESIIEAKKAGADVVKFQTFQSELGMTRSAPKADYQLRTTSRTQSQLEMVKKLELKSDEFLHIAEFCKELDIEFMSTAFDIPSLNLLRKLGVARLKVPSGDIDNVPLLEELSRSKLPLIISTGMCSFKDIDYALSILQQPEERDIAILHCTTEYPCPPEDVNLAAMTNLEKHYRKRVGLSDHSSSNEIPALAVAAGAILIEKHFTLSNSLEGPDHQASLNPKNFMRMCKKIRMAEKIMGVSEKKPTAIELKNKLIVRKSIVAKTPILAGEVFSVSNICMKRPGTGLAGSEWYKILGTLAHRDYDADEMIELI